MIKCPFCGFEGEFRSVKTWRFSYYEVKRFECPKCKGIFNQYEGVLPKGKRLSFTIRVRPRTKTNNTRRSIIQK